jgi:hypothetical protein
MSNSLSDHLEESRKLETIVQDNDESTLLALVNSLLTEVLPSGDFL